MSHLSFSRSCGASSTRLPRPDPGSGGRDSTIARPGLPCERAHTLPADRCPRPLRGLRDRVRHLRPLLPGGRTTTISGPGEQVDRVRRRHGGLRRVREGMQRRAGEQQPHRAVRRNQVRPLTGPAAPPAERGWRERRLIVAGSPGKVANRSRLQGVKPHSPPDAGSPPNFVVAKR